MQGTNIAKKADGWNGVQVKAIGLKEVKKMLAGVSVGPVCELDFETLQEDDRTQGEDKFQNLHTTFSPELSTWMKGTIVYPVIQAGTLGLILKSSLSFIPPFNQETHSQGLFVR